MELHHHCIDSCKQQTTHIIFFTLQKGFKMNQAKQAQVPFSSPLRLTVNCYKQDTFFLLILFFYIKVVQELLLRPMIMPHLLLGTKCFTCSPRPYPPPPRPPLPKPPRPPRNPPRPRPRPPPI